MRFFSRTTAALVVVVVTSLSGSSVVEGQQPTSGTAQATRAPGHARLAAGTSHSLYLHDDGQVYSWGSNARGQLGDGTTTSTDLPARVADDGALAGIRVVEVAAGPAHSLALADDGTVYAWGEGADGQLGTGSRERSLVPVEVQGELEGRVVVQVSAGGTEAASTSMAVTDDGRLFTWGSNLDGRAGHGPELDIITCPTEVAQSLEGLHVVRVAAGATNGSVVTSDGLAYAWGPRANGAIGSGGTTGVQHGPAPVSTAGVLAGVRLVDVAGGWGRTVSLDDQGRVYGWGDGSHGAHGNGGTAHATVPVLADMGAVAAVGVQPVAIASGQYFTVVLGDDGTLASWGAGTSGQLGDGLSASSSTAVAVSTAGVLADVEVVQVAAGTRHALALGSDGQVYAWGQGSSGELGHGQRRSSAVPVVVGLATPVTVEVLGSSSEAAPLLGGDGWAWSTVTVSVDGVEVGSASVTSEGRWLFRVPQVLPLGERTLAVTQSVDGSEAAETVDVVGHAVSAWGTGVGDDERELLDDLQDRRLVQVSAAATSEDFAVALTGDGSVAARGTDTHGQTVVPSSLETGVVQVAAGETFGLALTGDGTVVSWGDPLADVPAELVGRRAVQVAAGSRAAYALLSDGTIVAWGDDAQGQLRVPDGASKVVQVTGGGQFAAAVTAGGEVLVWGESSAGQTAVPAQVQGQVVAAEAGNDFVVALLRSGHAAAWGQHAQGQLAVPAHVQGDVVGLGAGFDVAMAVTGEGGVAVWGAGDHGLVDLPASTVREHAVQLSAGRSVGLALVDRVTITDPTADALVWVMDPLPVAGRAAPGSVIDLVWSPDGVGGGRVQVEVGPDGRWSVVLEDPLVAGRLRLAVASAPGAVDQTDVVVAHAPDARIHVVPRATRADVLGGTASHGRPSADARDAWPSTTETSSSHGARTMHPGPST